MSIKLIRQLALPAVALALLAFAILAAIRPVEGRAEPIVAPPSAPFAHSVSGVGVVEPEGEVVNIATELPGVVREVLVEPGQRVKAGDPLFKLDDRALAASHAEAKAQHAAALANIGVARNALADEEDRLRLFENIADKRAVSADELGRRKFAVGRARAALELAKAEAEAAQARVAAIETDLSRIVVAAPIDGEILSVDVRPGEFAAAGPLETPLVEMGATDVLHLRVEIDEADIASLDRNAAARASARGMPQSSIPLTFVRLEPRAVAKRTLAGGAERVDARVVEVVYALGAREGVFVGQRMDVYIDAARASRTAGAGL